MKITKTRLKQIIKEELKSLKEGENYSLSHDEWVGNNIDDGGSDSIIRGHMIDLDDIVFAALKDENIDKGLEHLAYTLEDNLMDVYKEIEKRGAHPNAKLGSLKIAR
tara:strand:+ start:1135 stop:1455 length:321 start_codon:yes stop_codon:yes gene_type:complete